MTMREQDADELLALTPAQLYARFYLNSPRPDDGSARAVNFPNALADLRDALVSLLPPSRPSLGEEARLAADLLALAPGAMRSTRVDPSPRFKDADEWVAIPREDYEGWNAVLLCLRALSSDAAPQGGEREWRCFHCEEVFTDERDALDHFGGSEAEQVACKLNSGEGELLRRLRAVNREAAKLRAELEQAEYDCGAQVRAEIGRLFKGARTPREAWNQLDSMEGRALAAEAALASSGRSPEPQGGERAVSVAVLHAKLTEFCDEHPEGKPDSYRDPWNDALRHFRDVVLPALASSGRDDAGAVTLIVAERERQKAVEGWTEAHDDEHDRGQLADAAAAYASTYREREEHGFIMAPEVWPWSPEWWKPTPDDRIRELVKAGALIVAEIERHQRLAAPRRHLTGGSTT